MRIAVLDDDLSQLELTRATLEAIGHDCRLFSKGMALLHELRRETYDLLILDWHLPDTSGPEIVRWIRANYKDRIPVLFLTNRNQEQDVVEGLSCGADDFMIKPMRVGELAARVQALLRRVYPVNKVQQKEWGRFHFFPTDRRVEIDGAPITLTQKEFDLAFFLFSNMGRLLSRQHLLDTMWGASNQSSPDVMSRTLDTHISKVRSLLGLRPENGFRLTAVYGQGYRFEALESPAVVGK